MTYSSEQRETRLADLKHKIKEQGLRITPQRVAILRALVMHSGHPTVEELHKELLPDFPSMSLATVYKTITMLKQQDEVLELEFSRDSRYDGTNPYPHPHLICKRCGSIIDPDVPGLAEMIANLQQTTGFSVTSHRLDFYGECPECKKAS